MLEEELSLNEDIPLDDFGNLPLLEDSCAAQTDTARPTAIAEDMSLFNIVNLRGLLVFYLGRDVIKKYTGTHKNHTEILPPPRTDWNIPIWNIRPG